MSALAGTAASVGRLSRSQADCPLDAFASLAYDRLLVFGCKRPKADRRGRVTFVSQSSQESSDGGAAFSDAPSETPPPKEPESRPAPGWAWGLLGVLFLAQIAGLVRLLVVPHPHSTDRPRTRPLGRPGGVVGDLAAHRRGDLGADPRLLRRPTPSSPADRLGDCYVQPGVRRHGPGRLARAATTSPRR